MQAFVSHALALPRVRSAHKACGRRRAAVVGPRMSETAPEAESDTKTAFAGEGEASNGATPGASSYTPPSFNTEIFSDFVESAQAKVDELSSRAQDVDPAEVLEGTKENAIGLVDNLLAGDWLNRGELYGAVQLFLVLLLLRSPGFLDGVIGFLVGPATLAAGALLSGKAFWDLGRKQVSIWPAPVPGAQLRTDGLYAQVRHPMYSGLLLASVGFAVSTGSPERAAVTVAMALFLAKKISVEEEFLAKTYDEWESYTDEVPYKILPKVW